MKKIAFFASGSGSNVENIVNYFVNCSTFEFPIIISNNNEAFVHERANKLNIPSVTFPKDAFVTGESIVEFLEQYKVDLIVLAGFLLKIPQTIIDCYPEKIINIHPALLPKYGGKGMYGDKVHQAVVDACETTSGITIHYVNANYDEGSIIFQTSCAVLPSDSADDVAQKVHALEYEYFPKIIEKLLK